MNEDTSLPASIGIIDAMSEEERYQHYLFIKDNLEKFERFGLDRIKRALTEYELSRGLK
jgi:hypothetical protein